MNDNIERVEAVLLELPFLLEKIVWKKKAAYP